ncbi:MAG: fibronectin type III domain-containing protein [Bacteroidota bacterium]
MKKIFCLFYLCLLSTVIYSQNYYWVGGSGNWSDLTHWATTSGGSTLHTTLPISINDVYFDSNSFGTTGQTVTIDVDASCLSIDWTGVTNSPSFVSNVGNTLSVYASLNFDSIVSHDLREIVFYSDNAGETIDAAGVTLGQFCDFTFEGSGEWTFENNAITRQMLLYNGTVNFGVHDITATGEINILGSSGPVTLNLESSTLIIGELETRFASSYTLNPGTSTIRMQGCCSSQTFYGGDQTYYNLELPNGSNAITGSNTFNKITISEGVTVEFEAGETQIFSELEAIGMPGEFIGLSSNSEGDQSTLTLASGGTAVEIHYAEIQDIIATGASTFTAFESIDKGNNSGWSIMAPVPQEYFWVGGTGNWSDLNHWATSSGGTTFYGELPTEFDNVTFDANSFATNDQTVTVDVGAICNDINWTGISHDVILDRSAGNNLEIYGSAAFSNLVEISSPLSFVSEGSETISMGDDPEVRKGTGNRIDFVGDGSWTVVDHLTTGSQIFVQNNATLNLNGKDVYSSSFNVLGSSTINTGDNATFTIEDWRATSSNLNFGSNVEIIIIQFSQFNSIADFDGGNNSFPTLSIQNDGQTIRLDGNNTFETLSIDAGATIEFEAGRTQTITNLNANGTKFNNIVFKSNNAGTQAILSKSSGTVDLTYIALEDMQATGGATFNAINSLDNGNNIGWNITAPVGQDYYWVGEGGDWTDLSHWVTSSGGSTQHSELPGSIDNIFFDANSFSMSDQEVTSSEDISFHDLDMSGVTNAPLMDVSTVDVLGSVALGAGVKFDASVINLNSGSSETITSNGAVGFSYVVFGSGGTYTVMDQIHIDNLDISGSGLLVLDNQVVEIVSFQVGDFGEAGGQVSALNATINAGNFQIVGTPTQVDLAGSVLTLGQQPFLSGSTSSSSHSLNVNVNNGFTFSYNDVIFDDGSVDIYYEDDLTMRDWIINAGIEVVFRDASPGGAFISIDDLSAEGTSADHIIFRSFSSGTLHRIASSSGNEVNVSWLELSDSEASGATFNANDSFDNGNNSGWTITAPPAVPSAPENLTTTGIASDEFTASWDPVAGADSYRIDVDNFPTFTTSLIDDFEVTGTSYTITGLTSADEYYWRVRAVNGSGASSNSDVETVLTLPQVPTALEAESIFANKFTAKWESVNGADSYRLDVSDNATFSSFVTGYDDLVVSGTSQEVDGLLEATEYHYRVRAVNTSGTTDNSNVIAATTASKQDQTISFELGSDAIKIFGDADFSISATTTSGLPLEFTSTDPGVASIDFESGVVSILSAGVTTLVVSQPGDDNFNAAVPVEQTLTVSKATQTITFTPAMIPEQSLSEGSVSFDITVNTGFVISASIKSGPATIASTGPQTYEATFNGSGVVVVEASVESTDDYEAAVEEISFNIIDDTKQDQTITFDLGVDAIKTFGEEAFTISATASSGLEVTFESSDPTIATVSGNEVTIIGAGTCSIIASQSGNESFNPAPSVEQELTVNKADQTITFEDLEAATFGQEPFELMASTSAGLEVSYEVENSFVASVAGNLITILSAGTTNITAIQEGNDNYNAAVSVVRTLTVNKAAQEITFSPESIEDLFVDAEDFSIAVSNSSGLDLDFESSDNIAITAGTDNNYLVEVLAAGDATITASSQGNSNYEEASKSVSFKVLKYDQTIDFTSLPEKTFGDDSFQLTATASSNLSVSYSSSDETVATISGEIVTIIGAGEATITASQGGNDEFSAATEVNQTESSTTSEPSLPR